MSESERFPQPMSGMVVPRFGDIATFMRLPLFRDPAEVEIGLIGVPWDGGTTNRPGAQATTRSYGEPAPRFAKGEEWGRFEFGSTIVLIAAPGLKQLDAQPPGTPLRLGQRIGRLSAT